MQTQSRNEFLYSLVYGFGVFLFIVLCVYMTQEKNDSRYEMKKRIISTATPIVTSVPTPVPTVVPTATPTPVPTPTPTLIPAWSKDIRVRGSWGLPVFNNHSKNLIEIIKECKRYYAENKFTYCMCPGNRYIPADSAGKKSCSNEDYSDKSTYRTDCSTLVSWVLYEYAKINGISDMEVYFSKQKSVSRIRKFGDIAGGEWFEVIPSLEEAMPGDIMASSDHIEFFAGIRDDGAVMVWSCGNDRAVANAAAVVKPPEKLKKLKYILRVKI